MDNPSPSNRRGIPMKVLVGCASRHGATAEIAERIAAALTGTGLAARLGQ